MNYRPDIDGLRTLAVVPVVLFHANVAGFTGGYIGVDVFFVISGFLITTIIQRELLEGRFSVVRFYERRARRILPALFAVIVASTIAGWFLLAPADYDKMGQSILSALLFVSNMWFWQNSGGYFQGATDYLPMLHTWSLAVEEQFYIFFPLLLMLLHRIGRRLVLPLIGVLGLVSLAVAIWATPIKPSAAFYLLPTRIWELGVGALLALGLFPSGVSKPVRETVGLLGLVAVLLPVFLYDGQTPFPGLAAVAPVAGAAALIWAGTAGPVFVSRLLALRPMVWIGLISYSLYLWHWPIMAFLRNRISMVEFEPLAQVATVTASLFAGWMSWRFIERPFRIPVRNGGLTQARIFALSGAGMAALGVVAVAVVMSDGAATQRFTDLQLATADNVAVDFPKRADCEGTRRIDKLCDLGAADSASAPRWLLWGDSHAGSMLPAVIDVGDRHQARVVFANKGNCPPLPRVKRSDMPPSESERCEYFRQEIIEHILSDDRIETVFLAARWPLYGEGGKPASEGHSAFDLIDTVAGAPDDTNPAVIGRALKRLVSRLTAAGKSVVIVQSVPEIPWNVAGRIRSEVLFGFGFQRETIDRDAVAARQTATNAALTPLGSLPGVRVIALADEICDPDCAIRDGFESYYMDSDHVTLLGALTLIAPQLERGLAAMTDTAAQARN